jgi:hypothetical protein
MKTEQENSIPITLLFKWRKVILITSIATALFAAIVDHARLYASYF